MSINLLMISSDRQMLKAGPVQRRMLKLAESLRELHVIVPAHEYKQQIGTNVWVYGSGGSNKISRWQKSKSLGNRIVQDRKCEVVTGQDPFELGFIAYLISKKNKIGLHLQDHGAFLGNEMFSHLSLRRRFQFHLGKWLIKKANAIRTVSERGKQGMLQLGVAEAKITVAPIATDISKYQNISDHSGREAKYILAVGRAESEKGFDLLLKSFSLVAKNYSDLKLTIVGDGSRMRKLKNLSYSLGLDKNVVWAGRQADVVPYYAAADIFVVPSYTEGWGLVVIEAAASGLPIVMTDVGCAGELFVNNISAVVVKAGSEQELAMGILKLIENPNLRRNLVLAASQSITKLLTPDGLMGLMLASYIKAKL